MIRFEQPSDTHADHVVVETEYVLITDVIDSFKSFLLAVGYSPELVKEAFGDDETEQPIDFNEPEEEK